MPASSLSPRFPENRTTEAPDRAREEMVRTQVAARGVTDTVVLDAMRVVPRHRFVADERVREAYDDHPLAIGYGQTISQPYIVAAMTQALALRPRHRVLEIGTGSGYQAAVLAEIAREVYTIEILDPLGRQAQSTLQALGYSNVHVRIGDGYQGWLEEAPFDAIILTAAPDHIPQPLVDQLAVDGKMALPLGEEDQTLVVLTKTSQGLRQERRFGVRFVPMTGEARKTRSVHDLE
ncbi:MAG: protein-L-isoaspartate(D-aspartate) O-methyltransferase [candidate division Zixibacteria bacterium]|nr:protein-L-isoaspartate(D-aspartate) O-methyltransferase [candidate division Zixibacteria bacterium]